MTEGPRPPSRIVRGASPEIESLSHEIKDLYAAPEGILYGASPLNLIGAAFLELDRYTDNTLYPEIEAHSSLINVEVDRILILGPDTTIQTRVLSNNAYGEASAGVVLTGPYAGLVFENGIFRVWPDRPIDHRLPDLPNVLKPEQHDVFLSRYRKYVTLRVENDYASSLSDLFFDLARRLDLKVDHSEFHLSKSPADPTA